jgi:hypothetical protein
MFLQFGRAGFSLPYANAKSRRSLQGSPSNFDVFC